MTDKKISFLIATATIIFSLSVLTACSNNSTSKETIVESTEQASSYATSSANLENVNIDITIIEKNKALTVSNPEKIIDVVEKSLKDDSILLNLMLTANQVEEYKSNGFYARIDYINDKELVIGTDTTPEKIKSIIILSDSRHGVMAITISDNYHQTFSIDDDNIISDIKSMTSTTM